MPDAVHYGHVRTWASTTSHQIRTVTKGNRLSNLSNCFTWHYVVLHLHLCIWYMLWSKATCIALKAYFFVSVHAFSGNQSNAMTLVLLATRATLWATGKFCALKEFKQAKWMRNNQSFSVRRRGGFKERGRCGSHSITHNLVISSKCMLLPGSFSHACHWPQCVIIELSLSPSADSQTSHCICLNALGFHRLLREVYTCSQTPWALIWDIFGL